MYAFPQVNFRSLSRTLLLTGSLAGIVLAATPSIAQNYGPADPPPAARLDHLQGNVSLQAAGVNDWGQPENNQPIGAGDRVYADNQSQGELQAGPTRAYFASGTDLTLTNLNDQGIELGLASGSAAIFSDGFPDGQSLFVSTPNGGITIAGRASFRVDIYTDQQAAVITNYPNGGDLQLNGAGGFALTLSRGQSIQLTGTNPVYTQFLEPAPIDPFARWSGAFEAQRQNSISARYVSPEMAGYDELDRTGDWQPESDYGPIWFPHVDAGWAPYHYGHWINRPFYGWTWVADEPWGAAPFHYGRWVQLQGRWGWIPGPRDVRPIWSPAQVVFAAGVQVGGVGVSVWFPLGPGEAYHPWYAASPEYINQINITNIRESRVVHVQNTYINVTNVTNVTYVNRTVGVTAMNQSDFAAGRSARTAAVKVDPHQIEHIQPGRPEARPPAQPVILRPVAKPAAVQPARPVLINQKGLQAPAAPNARPVAVPVKATPPAAPKPIPGHAAIGAPSVGGKPMAPAAPAPPMAPKATPQPVNPNLRRPDQAAPTPVKPAPTPVKPAPLTPAEKPSAPAPAVKPQPTARPVPPAEEKAVPPTKDAPKKGDKKDDKKDKKTPPKPPE